MFSAQKNMSTLPSWLATYFNENLVHDEIEHHNGGTSEHWDLLFNGLANLTSAEINIRANEICRLLQDSGVSQNTEAMKEWRLDPLPLMLSPLDWQTIESGIKQRVELLKQIKKDLYSKQSLVLNGSISANLLYAENRYTRECFNLPNQENGLFITAVDLYRDSNGQFKVHKDHCQTPSGLGSLLENRIVARRVMSEEFAECNVQRVANFFQLIQQYINDSTSSMVDPRVVIWSKGVDDPNYVEHTFLATYLGYTLVQSADLTVRKGKVWLKSLAGLRKVDIIIRWLPDNTIDSLEQAEYSIDGIPSIFQAIREGTVKVFNPLGSGLLESAIIKTQLPALSQQLLGAPLILNEPIIYPSSKIAELDLTKYELRKYNDENFIINFTKQSDQQLATNEITKAPELFYFKEKPNFSTAPFWSGEELIATPVIFRCYALSNNDEITVLPSALCIAQSKESTETNWVKDTWVNSLTNQEKVSLPSLSRNMMDLALLEGVISSRTAENLFWLGRYLERSENVVRLLRIYIDKYTELAVYPDVNNRKIVKLLMTAIQSEAIIYPFNSPDQETDKNVAVNNKKNAFDMFCNGNKLGSVLANLQAIVNTSLQVKDLLSVDTWRIVDDIEDQIIIIKQATIELSARDMQATLDKVIAYIMAFNGSIADSMSNSNGWFMLEMGRRIERSIQLTSTVQSLLTEELEEVEQLGLLEVVLLSQVSLFTHKRRYRMYQSVSTGLELLLLDAEYPRSLLFQLEQLHKLSKKLPKKNKQSQLANYEKALLQSKTSCYLNERENLMITNDGVRENLTEFLQQIRFNLDNFSEILLLQFFTHTQTPKKLSWSDSTLVSNAQ